MLEDRYLLATLPSGFTETVVASDLTSPITFDIEESGRIWLAFQDGRIEVIENDVLLPTLATQLDCDGSGERGLQGIELDPHFHDNGYIYVYYTAATPGSHNRVSRLTVDPTTENTIIAGSEVVLLELPLFSTLPQNQSPIWHMGGAIHFLPDETLVVQVGDHLNNSLVQNMDSPIGKVLRINQDGSAAGDNPLYNAADGISWRDYVWASGLRNPFSGDVDPATGRYFIGDVGEGTWEEINDATLAGRNFGWPTTEGNFNPATYPNFTNPFYAYHHSQDCAITGGAFYSPSIDQFPAQYQGMFFFSQFCAGTIGVIDPNNPANVQVFASGIAYPMNIEFTADGSMYFVERGAGAGGDPGIGTGKIVKIQYAAEIAPQIVAQPANTLVSVGYDATFTVSAAGTPPLAYQWQRRVGVDFVDIAGATGSTLLLPDVTLADDHARFRVVVSNAFGTATSNAAMLDVTTDTPPAPVIDLPVSGATYRAGDTIQFAGQAIDMEDGSLPASALTWQVDFHHATHLHPFMPPTLGIVGGEFTIPVSGETSDDVWYRVRFIATDSAGLTTETFRDILPEKSSFVVTNNLGGGVVLVDGQTREAPHAVAGVVNVQRSLEAPVTQAFGGMVGLFRQWLDGGMNRQRTISAPEHDTAYIAIYEDISSTLTFLSDLLPSNAPPPNGWGPIEKDTSNGEAAAGDGVPMAIGGVRYSRGLGVHAFSDVRYDLGGSYSRFLSDVGLDDETGNGGSVIFQVFGDGVPLYNSGVLSGSDVRRQVDVNIAGVNELQLLVTNAGDGDGLDHADWANARLAPQQVNNDIYINFQLDSATVPAGYLEDAGHVFANRGNGYSYGWSSNHNDVSRDRNLNSDQRLDTLVHFHNGATWEIALPDGAYAVTAVIGDAENLSTHTLNVEGVPYWTSLTLGANQFSEKTQVVTVNDGRLTIDQGTAPDRATRINYIEIVPIEDDAALLPLASADVTLNGKLSYADVLAFGAGWGDHDPGATLEQLVRAGDLNFDGTTNEADWDHFYQAWQGGGMPVLMLSAVLNPISGDFNRDGIVDDHDHAMWRADWGSQSELAADGNGNGMVDTADYVIWRKSISAQLGGNMGSAPLVAEVAPTPVALGAVGALEGIQVEAPVAAPSVPQRVAQINPIIGANNRASVVRAAKLSSLGSSGLGVRSERSNDLQLSLIGKIDAEAAADVSVAAMDEAYSAFQAMEVSHLGEDLLASLDDEVLMASSF